MINYILHVSLLLGLGFILYQVLLKKETFYALNRIILFGYLILAFVLPSIHIPSEWSLRHETTALQAIVETGPTEIASKEQQSTSLELIKTDDVGSVKARDKSSSTEAKTAPDQGRSTPLDLQNEVSEIQINSVVSAPAKSVKWAAAIKWIYIVGLSIFLINFLVQFGILMYYRIKYPTLKDGKMTIVEMSGDKAPFSFLNMIYINPTKYDYDTYEQILAHEKIHITKWHSADIFLAELALIFQWFNPFAWYYRRVVEHNLEYLTDQEMLASGANAEVYQMNLLKVSVPELPLALSTNYNQSFLKKRIQMMNAKKSSAQSTWKYLFILPILGLTVSLMNPTFSTAQSTPEMESTSQQILPTDPVMQDFNLDNTTNIHESKTQTSGIPTLMVGRIDDLINPMQAIENSGIPMQRLSDYGITDEEPLSVAERGGEPAIVTSANKSVTVLSSAGRVVVTNATEDIESKGIWEAEIDGNDVCFFIKKGGIDGNYFWSSTECMKTSEFSPKIKAGAKGEFTLTREAGTMVLKGEFDGNDGTGRYSFVPDASYSGYIKSQGYDVEEKKIIHFFLSDIDKDYFEFLKMEGYSSISDDELVSMAIHGVDKEYIKNINGEFKKVNYKKPSAKELTSMKIHDVDMNYIKSFGKELYEDLDVDQIISAAIHDVDPTYISRFREMGFEDLTFDNLISAAIHDVDIDYVRALKSAGFTELSFDDLISASIHDVDPAYIRKFQDAGFANLDFDDLISASIHDVDPDYIKAFEDAGFSNLSFDDLVSASIHDVDIDFIKAFQGTGFKNLDFDDLVSASIHDVDIAYLREFQSMGFDDLSFDDLITAAIHNVSPKYIKEMRDAGFSGIGFDDIVSFKIHNIDLEDIKGLRDLGFDLDEDEVISAGIHNVTPRFIKKMREKGYKDLSFDEYLKLKIHGF